MVNRQLLIDTCTEYGFTAYADQGNILFQAFLGDTFDCAQSLVPVLNQQLIENSIQMENVDAICVTKGPGSYTGMRVGVIVAKALAFALSKPLIGVPSTELYSPLGMLDGSFAVLLDARMGGVYGAIGSMRDGLAYYDEPFTLPIESLSEVLAGIRTIVSPHAPRLQEKCTLLREFDWHQAQPSAKRMDEAAALRWKNGDFSSDAQVDILYLRKTQAEIEREKRLQESNP